MCYCCADLYGPQQADVLSSAAEAVATGVELIVDDLQDIMPQEHLDSINSISRVISFAHDNLAAEIVSLQQTPETCSEE